MYSFSPQELSLLRRLGASSHGREFSLLLQKVSDTIDKSSNIDANSDYGAQVEGRKIAVKLFQEIISAIKEQDKSGTHKEIGIDEFD